jgi:hypothetical protein
MKRRQALILFALRWKFSRVVAAHPIYGGMTLLNAPLQLAGPWRGSPVGDATAVVARMRAACLSDVALLSDHQPSRLRVDDHSEGPPAIWLHSEFPTTAWMIVDVGPLDWCNLCYQFGHELGHVVCNSWQPDAAPRNPCQWIEEALVEAFSLRGLGRLADAWEQNPPFPHDNAYAGAIRNYRDTILGASQKVAHEQGMGAGFGAWFGARAAYLATHGAVNDARGAVGTMFRLYAADPPAVADLGALNRWEGRSGVPAAEYLRLWQESCAALGTPGRLPMQIAALFAGK